MLIQLDIMLGAGMIVLNIALSIYMMVFLVIVLASIVLMPTPVGLLKSVSWNSKDNVECLAVLSDWICSFGAINDGSSEQYCSIVG